MFKFDEKKIKSKINVTQEMVEEYKQTIKKDLKRSRFVSLSYKMQEINEWKIDWPMSKWEDAYPVIAENLSDYIAYQEAVDELVKDGVIIPVKYDGQDYFKVRMQFRDSENSRKIDSYSMNIQTPHFRKCYRKRS